MDNSAQKPHANGRNGSEKRLSARQRRMIALIEQHEAILNLTDNMQVVFDLSGNQVQMRLEKVRIG